MNMCSHFLASQHPRAPPPQAPELTEIFCTLTHPHGPSTSAAFDLCPQRDCDVGSYIPVGVRLHELSPQTDALLLTVYLPVGPALPRARTHLTYVPASHYPEAEEGEVPRARLVRGTSQQLRRPEASSQPGCTPARAILSAHDGMAALTISLLTMSLPAPTQDPLFMRLDKPSEQIVDCGDFEVALGLNEGAAELFVHFGNAPLKKAFMEYVCSAAQEPKRRRQ